MRFATVELKDVLLDVPIGSRSTTPQRMSPPRASPAIRDHCYFSPIHSIQFAFLINQNFDSLSLSLKVFSFAVEIRLVYSIEGEKEEE